MENKQASTIKKITAIIISVVLGLIFLFSGYTKLLPVIETFEFTFVDFGIANWYTAPVLARLLIGLELFIGIMLIICYNLKKFTIPFTSALLIFFILYLLVQILMSGNSGNCGCFGEYLQMTPLEGILKNVLMLIGCFIISRWHEGWRLRMNWLLPIILLFPAMSVPYILNPVDYSYTSNNLQEKTGYRLELELLYEPVEREKVETPKVELREGKQVVAFLSLTCSYCRIAAKKFRLIKKNNPAIPIYFVLNGDKHKLPDFLEDTKASNIPHSFCHGKTFVQLASAHLPRIYYLENSIVVKKVDYYELNQYELESWLNGTPLN